MAQGRRPLSSNAPTDLERPSGRLVVTGPAGMEIQVLDGRYRVMDRGAERLEAELPTGLYVVRWLAADEVHEEVVQITPERKATRASYAPPERLETALRHTSPANRKPPSAASAIVVLEQAEDPRLRGKLSKGVRLYDADQVAQASDSTAVAAVREQFGENRDGAGWAVRVYPVSAGAHRLRFETVQGYRLNYTVPAIAGRRTLVLLRQTSGQALVRLDGRYTTISQRGADPTRTVLLSTPQTGATRVAPDHLRLADTLLAGLATGRDVLSAATMKRLFGARTDPLLQLYAVVLILSALQAGRSPALDDPAPASARQRATFRARWRREAQALLNRLPKDMADLPDVVACRHWIADRGPAEVANPPMLAACAAWTNEAIWAARPDAETGSPGSRPISRAGAWLVQRASLAKGGELDAVAGLSRERDYFRARLRSSSISLGLGVVAAAAGVVAAIPLVPEFDFPNLLAALRRWSPALAEYRQILVVALTAAAAGLSAHQLFSAAWMRPSKPYARFVERRPIYLEATDRIPNTALAQIANKHALALASPHFRQPILHADDPQKGRFGGLAERGGYRLSASFGPSDRAHWVEVDLRVTAAPGAGARSGDQVVFFLHDSFDESQVVQPLVDNLAELHLSAYGGFTVGVWLPRANVALELDLAELPDAPQIIRDW